MDPKIERRIRERAHEIWEEEGRPHGRDQEHWQRAEAEVMGEVAVATDPRAPTGEREEPTPPPRPAERAAKPRGGRKPGAS